jgi:hypothetical protein
MDRDPEDGRRTSFEAEFFQHPDPTTSEEVARAAPDAGDHFFQISLPLMATQRTVMGVLGGDKMDVKTTTAQHTDLLGTIESVRWRLKHVPEARSFVSRRAFRPSRTAITHSGCQTSTNRSSCAAVLERVTRLPRAIDGAVALTWFKCNVTIGDAALSGDGHERGMAETAGRAPPQELHFTDEGTVSHPHLSWLLERMELSTC